VLVGPVHEKLEWGRITSKCNPLATSLVSDASDAWGCGAYSATKWFQWQWEGPSSDWVIAAKKLLPVLLVGKMWAGCCIECYCDNMAVVSVINSNWAKEKH